MQSTRQLWDQKRRGLEEYEALRKILPPDAVSFAQALAWNDAALRWALAAGKPLLEDSLKDKVDRVMELKRALAIFPR
ncbi:MAG: hypothetical protein ACR2M4_08795 [Actinomycetota bacterium]